MSGIQVACRASVHSANALLRYAAAGAAGTGVHFAVLFATLQPAGPVLASTLGAVAGMVTNYFLARHVVFAASVPHRHAFVRFVLVALCGISVNAVVVRSLVDVLPIALNQVVASATVLLLGFTLNKRWTFHDRRC